MHYASRDAQVLHPVLAVLQETQSGSHKVKVSGLMISELAGEGAEGVRNCAAVEYVHDISMRAKDGKFDVKNHAR